MNGLNAYPRSIPRFQSGGSTGFSIGTAPAPSGGVLDAFTSPMQGTPTISTPFGTTHGLSMSSLIGLTNPALAAPLTALTVANSLYGAFNEKQEPAPIDDAVVDAYSPPAPGIAIGAPAGVSVEGISPGYTEPGKAQSVLESMIATQQEEQAQAETEANQATAAQQAVDAAMDVTSTPSAPTPGAMDQGIGVSEAMGGGGGGGGGTEGGGPSVGATTHGGEAVGVGADSSDPGESIRTGGLIKKYRYGGQVMNYAQGGEAYGRGGDSMLVHMNPREVAGLQALARSNGTSMTINPNTGYPEAFNLKALLPALVGLGLNAFAPGVGSAIGSALGTSGAVGTGIAVGGATAAATGSLQKGIMAGLGAYGGAGLGEGLAGSAGLAGNTPPTPGMEGIAGSGVSATPLPTNPSMTGAGLSGTTPAGGTGLTSPANFAGANMGTGITTPSVFPPQPEMFEVMGASPGGTGATISPSTSMSSISQPGFIDRVGGAGSAFKYGSAALAPALQPEPYEPPKSTAMIRPFDFSYNPQTGAYDREPGDSSEAMYFRPTFTAREPYMAAEGGLMNSYAAGGLTAFKQGGRPKSRPLVGEDYYKFMGRDDTMLGTAEKNFAGGGTPRFLSGGGDGMSDDIPAVIGDKQPARLADGEFVIPADVVSHLGNGSSKAGAKRLYEMMDKIRSERTGTKKQAPAIKPSKFMPA
jgi:hypothetical protein